MYKVFVSYCHENKNWVFNQLIPKLTENSIEVLIDKNIPRNSDDWREDIDSYIDQCDVFLLVMTPDASKSQYVTFEWSYALGHRKNILVIKIGDFKKPKPHPRIQTRQMILFKDFNDNAPFDELVHEVKNTVDSKRETITINRENLYGLIIDLRESGKLSSSALYKFLEANILELDDIRSIENALKG